MEKYIGKRPTSEQKMLATMNKKLLSQAQGIILASEEKILKVIEVEMDKKKAGESKGLLLLTSNSLIFISSNRNFTKEYSSITRTEIREVKEIKEVNNVKQEKVVANRQKLLIKSTNGEIITFDMSKSEDTLELIEVLEAKVANPNQEILTTVTHDFDYFLHAENLMKLRKHDIKTTHLLNKRDDLGFTKNGQRLLKEQHKGATLIIEGYFKEKKKTNDFIVVDKNIFVYEYNNSERKAKLIHKWPLAFFANSIVDYFVIKTEVITKEGKLVLNGSGKDFVGILSDAKIPFVKKERKLYQKTIGFRSGKLWKKIAVSLVYLSVLFLILMFSFGNKFPGSDNIDAAEKVSATAENVTQGDKIEIEDQQKQDDEEARLAEEKEAEVARLAEEKEKEAAAEEARLAEEKKKEEEAARIAEEQKQAEEAARVAEEQKQAEEAARVAEEQKQAEELALAAAEQKQQEEAAAAAAASQASNVYYENCTAVRAAGAAPIRTGEPGYSFKLDRDRDGIACEI